MKSLPNFDFENEYWEKGCTIIIGIDEVGRGSLAGPVVAGAVMLRTKNNELGITKKDDELKFRNSYFAIRNSILNLGINDSKKLSPKRREGLSTIIPKYFDYGIGLSTVAEIDRLGIVNATQQAMERAIISIKYQVLSREYRRHKNIPNTYLQITDIRTVILVDGLREIHSGNISLLNQEAIVKGDGKCISIAAASIMAKVYRDKMMTDLSKKYPKYGWERNKGYGTKIHMKSIRKNGVTKLHRKKFVDGIIK